MSGYIGTQPVPQATQTRDSFVATGGQTSFATSGYTPGFLDVYLNGVHLVYATDYTAANGSDVILAVAATASDVVEVVAFTTFESAIVAGGATGGGSDQVFYENDQNVTANYTIVATKNAMTAGPISVTGGAVVTVESGARWVIL